MNLTLYSPFGNRSLYNPPRHHRIRCQASSSTKFLSLDEINIKSGKQRSLPFPRNGSSVVPENGPNQQQVIDPISSIKSIFLPQGWPKSVTTDYLRYQLWTFPSHVTGWISNSLAGSSMLKALGVGIGPAGAVGFSAAIKWVTKDGVGALGRLFVGSSLSSVFDEDPKYWRMVAEAMTTLGLSLEIATQISPANFVILAGSGTLIKAVGKGMGRPCFRVIQTHFSATNNVGDVAAKEEVWEVVAQMLGLAISVGILNVVDAFGVPEAVVPLWAGVHAVHVVIRYAAIRQLSFPYPNMKRGSMLVRRYADDGGVITVDEANREEHVLKMPDMPCTLGCSLDFLLTKTTLDISSLISVYSRERYILIWNEEESASYVVLIDGYTPIDILRALWQTEWMSRYCMNRNGEENDTDKNGDDDDILLILEKSLRVMEETFPELEERSKSIGWKLNKGVFPVGNYVYRLKSEIETNIY